LSHSKGNKSTEHQNILYRNTHEMFGNSYIKYIFMMKVV